jgi:hypothetical protein
MRIPAIKPTLILSTLIAASTLALGGCSTEEEGGGSGKIQLTHPKGGETFKEGDSLYITWKVGAADMGEFTSVQPRISLDDGASWVDLRPTGSISTSSPNWGRWGWKIDSVIVGGAKKPVAPNTTVRFRVQEYSTQKPELIATTSKASTIQAK